MALDLAFESVGDGPPLLILHGLFGSAAELRGLRFARPMHVVAGRRSNDVTHTDGAEYQPMFARARVDVIESAGHWVHAERPEAFVAALHRALQGTAVPVPN